MLGWVWSSTYFPGNVWLDIFTSSDGDATDSAKMAGSHIGASGRWL